ncbi:sugar-transfer associated ATP-grasp domain-containing protein [Marinobacter salicampi]|uniref:sugar-transfer associated ATP-grasp domain-containing protein n=1 Tax=Marinobacter salicampi TaxID=435907 RepID=UPI00140B6D26|nr:sugar-transfer associated ATP-grasp domain-containing protein [Marinobacter salicampi]
MGIIGKARRVRHFLKTDRRYGVKPDFLMLRDGFFSKRRYFYPFDKYHKALFITDWEIEFHFRTLNPNTAKENLKNKIFFQLMLRHTPLADSSPGLIGSVSNGQYRSYSEFSTVNNIFDSKDRVFLKPASGWGGERCFLATSPNDIPDKGTYVIENCAEPHPYALTIFPYSINTIRVFTLKDEHNEPFIVGAAHRFGGQADSPIDNFSKGGISCGIDMATGILKSGTSNPGAHATILHQQHPVTKVDLAGVQIPFWEDVKNLALDLARYYGDLNYAGWDIYVSPNGPKIIEGNGDLPNPNLIQVHSPLLVSNRVRNQLYNFGMISKKRKEFIDQLCQTSHKALDIP